MVSEMGAAGRGISELLVVFAAFEEIDEKRVQLDLRIGNLPPESSETLWHELEELLGAWLDTVDRLVLLSATQFIELLANGHVLKKLLNLDEPLAEPMIQDDKIELLALSLAEDISHSDPSGRQAIPPLIHRDP